MSLLTRLFFVKHKPQLLPPTKKPKNPSFAIFKLIRGTTGAVTHDSIWNLVRGGLCECYEIIMEDLVPP